MSEIKEAIKKGDSKVLNDLLESGADYKEVYFGTQFSTPLHYAAEKNKGECIKLLVNYGADVNIKNKHGDTPLHLASQFVRLKSVKALLKCGADPNISGQDDKIVLEYAIRSDDYSQEKIEIVNLLLSHGADINKSDKRGYTLLHYAVYDGILTLVKFLVENGSKNIRNYNGQSPSEMAIEDGKHEIAQYIEEKLGPPIEPSIEEKIDKEINNLENETKEDKSDCFVATAIYGSYDSFEVKKLQQWRDSFLSKYIIGKIFIQIYYRIGPSLATFVKTKSFLKNILKVVIDFIIKRIDK